MDLTNPHDLFRRLDPARDPEPDAAAALVRLAEIETKSSHQDKRIDAGGHVAALARWRWDADRAYATAEEIVLHAAAKAVAAELVRADATGDTVAIPIGACRVVEHPGALARETLVTYLVAPPGLDKAMRRMHQAILDPRLLPAGHPLLGIVPVTLDGDGRPSLFVGGATIYKGSHHAPCVASISETKEVTGFFRDCQSALDARRAEERRKREEKRVKDDEAAQLAREVAELWARDPSGMDDKIRVHRLERQVKLLNETTVALLKEKAEAEAAKTGTPTETPAK